MTFKVILNFMKTLYLPNVGIDNSFDKIRFQIEIKSKKKYISKW